MNQDIPFLELKKLHQSLKPELMEVMSEAVDNAAFIGGKNLSDFEHNFATYAGTEYAIGLSNGTDALRLSMIAMGLPAGSKVITVPNTFIATTEAISQAGGQISFVDVNSDTALMCPNRLEDHLKKIFEESAPDQRPSMIVPVHLYGQCADMDSIQTLADKYELTVMEDAAQSHGATYKTRLAGGLAQAAAFSFYPGKNLGGCGDAGAVTTNDAKIAATVKILRDHGQKEKYIHQMEGYNCRMDAIQAGFLNVKLNHISDWNEQRRMVSNQYDQAFASAEGIQPIKISKGNISSRHLYVAHVSDRNGLLEHLKREGIGAGMHYPVPLHLQPCYKHLKYQQGDYPNTEKLSTELISLPLFPGMTTEQVSRVIASVETFLN